jgi:hypothetical protein
VRRLRAIAGHEAALRSCLKSHVYGIKNGDGATRRRVGMGDPHAMRARGSMAAALHIPFQTASKMGPFQLDTVVLMWDAHSYHILA